MSVESLNESGTRVAGHHEVFDTEKELTAESVAHDLTRHHSSRVHECATRKEAELHVLRFVYHNCPHITRYTFPSWRHLIEPTSIPFFEERHRTLIHLRTPDGDHVPRFTFS